MDLEIRTYQPGDESGQVAVYNTVAAKLPGFKPATSEDVRRRTKAKDFDPALRFYALAQGQIVGYCVAQANGRLGYPWTLPGHAAEEPLLNAALDACRARGIKKLFATYRADWAAPIAFLEAHEFRKARDMVNYYQNLLDLPTMVIRRGLNISPLKREDLRTIAAFVPGLMRLPPDKLEEWFFANPYFPPESIFVMRKADETPSGVAALVSNPSYANPLQIDSAAPCFRLGAFGNEGLTTKRVNGLFSFLVRDDGDATPIALDLLSFALNRIQDDSIEVLCGQAPSDVRHLTGFYQKYFRKQGSFPIYERELN
ncbi:MAG: hypothetical protein K8T89_12350 [Planctomycetes bacterium]|nr:hypothetical protein [Planctomycetota bacterium]